MTELTIQRIGPLENYNKDKLKEFMKSIPETDLMDIGIPTIKDKGLNIFESDILRGNLIPYIAEKNNEIWGMAFRWKSSAIYIPSYKRIDKDGNLNLARLDGWELLGCYTAPGRTGAGVFGSLSRDIIEDVKIDGQLMYLIVRANHSLEKELKSVYEKHIENYNEIFEKKEYDFAAYVNYLIEQKVPAEEVVKLLESRELFDKRAGRLEYLWSKLVNEGQAFCVGNYFVDGAPLFISNNYF